LPDRLESGESQESGTWPERHQRRTRYLPYNTAWDRCERLAEAADAQGWHAHNLGHKSPRVTLDRYVRALPGRIEEALRAPTSTSGRPSPHQSCAEPAASHGPVTDGDPKPAILADLHEQLCAQEDEELRSEGVSDRYLIIRPVSPPRRTRHARRTRRHPMSGGI
jgi:hypothetical protein